MRLAQRLPQPIWSCKAAIPGSSAMCARLATMPGAIPHPLNRPPGCPFHPRCDRAVPGLCDRDLPAALALPDGRTVACVLHAGTQQGVPA